MIDKRQLSSLNVEGVTISAQIHADGILSPVEGGFHKLLAAAKDKSLPRIHTLIVHPNQKDIPSELSDPHSELRVFKAWTLEEAIQQILVDEQTRWGEIPDFQEFLSRARDYVGREWLSQQVETAIHNAVSGQGPAYILITGKPGTGKSAFVAHQVSKQPASAFHFIRRGDGNLDDPEVLLNSLVAQLRRIYALPVRAEEQTLSAPDAFRRILRQVSRKLEDGQHQTIWIDGLDEAFGPLGRFSDRSLSEFISLNGLPEGIVLVLTSRPGGEHLRWLEDPGQFFSISIDAQVRNSKEDIQAYLARQNKSLALGLGHEFLDRLVEASEGCFVAAVRYLHPNPSLKDVLAAWQVQPQYIPKGLNGWLNWQWQWLLKAAREQNLPERPLIGVLGYLAVADEKERAKILFHFLSEQELEVYWDRVLQLSSELVERVQVGGNPNIRYRFFHPHFGEFIWEKVKQRIGQAEGASVSETPKRSPTEQTFQEAYLSRPLSSTQPNLKRRGKETLLIIGIVVIMAILLGGGILLGQGRQAVFSEGSPSFASTLTSPNSMPVSQVTPLAPTLTEVAIQPSNPLAEPSSTPEVSVTSTQTFQLPAEAAEYLEGVQPVKLDSFDPLSAENWDLVTISKISNGVLESVGDEINWNQTGLRRAIMEGEGVLFLARYTNGAQFDLFLQSGEWEKPSYRRFGINGGGKPSEHVWVGPQYSGDYLNGKFSPQPNHWYYVLMAIDDQANGMVAIWDPEHPEERNSYKKEMGEESGGQYWGFSIEVFRGIVQVDDFYIVAFDRIP